MRREENGGSGAVGRTKWKRWQLGCFDGRKSGTATQLCFGVEGPPPPRLVSLYFIVREKKRERNTRDVM